MSSAEPEVIYCDCGSGHHWIGGMLQEPDPANPKPPRRTKPIEYTSPEQLEAEGFVPTMSEPEPDEVDPHVARLAVAHNIAIELRGLTEAEAVVVLELVKVARTNVEADAKAIRKSFNELAAKVAPMARAIKAPESRR